MTTKPKPKRIQMTRNKPWRADNPDAVIVARPSAWGNPFRVGPEQDAGEVVARFSLLCAGLVSTKRPLCDPEVQRRLLRQLNAHLCDLRGKDLACWCAPDQPCHGDVLLVLANA